jgi:hypothetical protein
MDSEEVIGREILDSRGNPTVEADVRLISGCNGHAALWSSAWMGEHGAVELRNNDDSRYFSKGTFNVVRNLNDKRYEVSGYDNTRPRRLPNLQPHVSAKRIVDWGANAVKILIYYTPFDDIGAKCESYEIPFFLEFVGYYPKGRYEKDFELAKTKPEVVVHSMEEFSTPQYKMDVLNVQINANYVEGSSVRKGQEAYSRQEALNHFPRVTDVAKKPVIYLNVGVSNAQFIRSLKVATRPAPIIRAYCASVQPGRKESRYTKRIGSKRSRTSRRPKPSRTSMPCPLRPSRRGGGTRRIVVRKFKPDPVRFRLAPWSPRIGLERPRHVTAGSDRQRRICRRGRDHH